MLLDGSKIATERRTALQARVARASEHSGSGIGLGIIVATDNAATQSYVRAKERAAQQVGYAVSITRLPSDAPESALLAACDVFNLDPAITGYIVQLPLPAGVRVASVMERIDPLKDADGLTPHNLGKLLGGSPHIIPATAHGVLTLLEQAGVELAGTPCTVVGKGLLAGRPIAAVLAHHGATVTVCDSLTKDLGQWTRQAAIVVTAAGVPSLLQADMVSAGATVIDVGITGTDDGLRGDVDYDAVASVASVITPVPGGVGPMTVVSLLENVETLHQLRLAS